MLYFAYKEIHKYIFFILLYIFQNQVHGKYNFTKDILHHVVKPLLFAVGQTDESLE